MINDTINNGILHLLSSMIFELIQGNLQQTSRQDFKFQDVKFQDNQDLQGGELISDSICLNSL